ncbi:glycoside hydrolase family 15 protein [Nocardioidaceae bacterium SCSIO 66511]|nr:glycoside hydrolase family 15 protein [Nocardioidaceae bacterium SCSIO 66511]
MAQRIEDYALVGDLQTAALIGKDGGVDWLCLPRFDSGACFAAMLADEDAGRWRIAPAGARECTRRSYRGDTLVLQTEWDTPDGAIRVIDFMPLRGKAADIVRIVEGVSGRVTVEVSLKLRFDYGSVVPWVRHTSGQLEAVAGPDAVWLRTPVAVHGRNLGSYATFEVAAGDRVPFVLTHQESHLPAPTPVDPERALRDTESFWRNWIATADVPDRWAEPVRRSLIILKALTYAPTGGVLAAATTSLPEQIGGERNWDYRYCWLRDSTFTLGALLGCGYDDEAEAWRAWLLRAVAGEPADLQIMYGVDGTRRLPEAELDWLAGYEGSRPVRIGNAASEQLQLDVWGEVLDSLHLARTVGLAPDDHAWDIQQALLDHLERNWTARDNGIWEGRGPRRDFVYSKVMCWVGLDRGVQAVERFGLDGPVDRWRAARDQIHAEVCSKGFDAERNTFTQFYGSQGLDAALLLMPRTGFLPPDDPRIVGTVDAIGRELSRDGLILRYDPSADGGVDGLEGTEGTFLACSFWMVYALHLIGRRDDAVELFERLLTLRSDLGLLAEEYDVPTSRQLGNTPQAYSHVGLVNCARALSGQG